MSGESTWAVEVDIYIYIFIYLQYIICMYTVNDIFLLFLVNFSCLHLLKISVTIKLPPLSGHRQNGFRTCGEGAAV